MMKQRTAINLTPLDDLFQTDASREDSMRERVQEIPLCDLHTFENHPFKVLEVICYRGVNLQTLYKTGSEAILRHKMEKCHNT